MNDLAESVSPALRCEQVDPLAGDAWDRLVAKYPAASVFHGAAWARLLHRTYGHRPRYLRFVSGDATVALVPLMEVRSPFTGTRGICLPFSDFCGPLLSDASRTAPVLSKLIEICRDHGWSHLDLRSESLELPEASPWRTHRGHVLDLSAGLAALEKALPDPVRRSIRKADRSGLKIESSQSLEAVRAFYRLHCRTRRRHGVPPQSYRFFDNLYQEIIGKDNGYVVLAKLGETPVAGAVFLKFQESAIYKFGASDVRFWSLRPNHAVMWEGIQAMFHQGCRTFHFGRTSPVDLGLARFKSSWGAAATTIRQYRHVFREGAWKGGTEPAAESHRAVFGWLPLRFNRILGSLIYPHLD